MLAAPGGIREDHPGRRGVPVAWLTLADDVVAAQPRLAMFRCVAFALSDRMPEARRTFRAAADRGPRRLRRRPPLIVVLNNDAPFSQPGDSGSLIVDDSRHPVALLFAGDGRYTLGNPINDVLAAFGLTVA